MIVGYLTDVFGGAPVLRLESVVGPRVEDHFLPQREGEREGEREGGRGREGTVTEALLF